MGITRRDPVTWTNMVEVCALSVTCCYLAWSGDTLTGICDRVLQSRYRYLVPGLLGAGIFHVMLEGRQ